MNLKLTNPLAFLDLETTGLNIASDRIVEISIIKIMPNGDKEIKTKLINPTIPIPAEVSLVHGITDKDVKDKATFKEVAQELIDFIANADLAGYNSNKFDIPLLAEEFLRAGVDFDVKTKKLIDVQNIFHKMEKRTLSAAYEFYCNKELKDAHSAEADTLATFEILDAQIARYKDLKPNTTFLSEFSQMTNNADLLGRIVYNKDGVETFNFGKHKGKTVLEVLDKEPGYYSWMMNGDFPLYTKKILQEIKENIKIQQQQPTIKKVAKSTSKDKGITPDKLDMLKNKFNS
jgi:DNA polymerase-3 subunit epsilon